MQECTRSYSSPRLHLHSLACFASTLHISAPAHLQSGRTSHFLITPSESSGGEVENVKPVVPVSARGERSPSGRDQTRPTGLDVMRGEEGEERGGGEEEDRKGKEGGEEQGRGEEKRKEETGYIRKGKETKEGAMNEMRREQREGREKKMKEEGEKSREERKEKKGGKQAIGLARRWG